MTNTLAPIDRPRRRLRRIAWGPIPSILILCGAALGIAPKHGYTSLRKLRSFEAIVHASAFAFNIPGGPEISFAPKGDLKVHAFLYTAPPNEVLSFLRTSGPYHRDVHLETGEDAYFQLINHDATGHHCTCEVFVLEGSHTSWLASVWQHVARWFAGP